MPTRRYQRENALKLNYALYIFGRYDGEHLERTADQFAITVTDFTRQLVEATCRQDPRHEELIDSLAKNTDMIANLDRLLMKQGMEEMGLEHSPAQTVINEYIELAKIYGAENAFRFVNVVLNKVKENSQ